MRALHDVPGSTRVSEPDTPGSIPGITGILGAWGSLGVLGCTTNPRPPTGGVISPGVRCVLSRCHPPALRHGNVGAAMCEPRLCYRLERCIVGSGD